MTIFKWMVVAFAVYITIGGILGAIEARKESKSKRHIHVARP